MKKIFCINGSASTVSANQQLLRLIRGMLQDTCQVELFEALKSLPHFDPALSVTNPPEAVVRFRTKIQEADGIIFCTPEYVFSIPSGLKNAIEWCIATTVFENKPTGLITASAQGQKGHAELQLIMQTAMARFTEATTLLIPGIRGVISAEGTIRDTATQLKLTQFVESFRVLAG